MQSIDSTDGPVVGDYRWCRRTEDHLPAAHLHSPNRHIHRVIFRRCITFIGSVLLLINNQQSQIWKRCERRGTGTGHNINFPIFCLDILVITLTIRHPGIHDRYPASKSLAKTCNILISQRNLGNQHDSLPARRQRPLDQLHIDLCLTASRNTVKQMDHPLIFTDAFHRLLLFPGEMHSLSILRSQIRNPVI